MVVVGRTCADRRKGCSSADCGNRAGLAHLRHHDPRPGQNALKIALADSLAVESWKGFQPEPLEKELFGEVSQVYKDSAEFLFEIDVATDAPGESTLSAAATFAVCNDQFCFPARTLRAQTAFRVDAGAATAAALPAGYEPIKVWETAAKPAPAAVETSAASATPAPQDQGLLSFAAVAFGFGLLAIFTPCVFPMIPDHDVVLREHPVGLAEGLGDPGLDVLPWGDRAGSPAWALPSRRFLAPLGCRSSARTSGSTCLSQ